MPNPEVPDFTELGARKLAELQANGYRITGYCFERQTGGTQPQRGFVDFAGFVGWHQPVAVPFRCVPTLITEQINHLRNTAYRDGADGEPTGLLDRVHERLGAIILTELNKARQQNAAHGVADMKGGQDA